MSSLCSLIVLLAVSHKNTTSTFSLMTEQDIEKIVEFHFLQLCYLQLNLFIIIYFLKQLLFNFSHIV